MNISFVRALRDNYIWILHHQQNALVIDPSQATPVVDFLRQNNLNLTAVLITHHHWDHIDGLTNLYQQYRPQVYAPNHVDIKTPYINVNNVTEILWRNIRIEVIQTPGHTLTHCCYFIDTKIAKQVQLPPLLFSGDTLFAAGCGRVFEGTSQQMFESLAKLKELPKNTLVCCGHDYTLSNLKFAQVIEPYNKRIQEKINECLLLQEKLKPCIPTELSQELSYNPFLRTNIQTVQQSVSSSLSESKDEVDVFAALRDWKNKF